MKKILLISNMYPDDNNKHYGIFVKNVEELLIKNGYDVDKVIMFKTKNKFIKLIKYIIFHLKVIFKGLFNKYDYLYVHFVSHSSLGAVFVKKIKKNIKLILNCHGNDVIADTNIDLKNIDRSKKYLKYADKVIVPSNYFKDVIKRNYQVKEDKLFIYPSGGVNTNLFIPKDKDECMELCKLDKSKKYIGYISRIEKDKGWDTYLNMIKELVDNNLVDDYKFLLVGSGDEEFEMNSLIERLEIKKYLDIRGFVSQEELVNLYNCLEVFVFPTRRKSDSLGLVGLEAMSCKTIVLTGDKYGPTDYIKDNINGFMFSIDNNNLKDKLLEIINLDNKEKELIKENARKTAIEYDIDNTKNIILEVFK